MDAPERGLEWTPSPVLRRPRKILESTSYKNVLRRTFGTGLGKGGIAILTRICCLAKMRRFRASLMKRRLTPTLVIRQ